MIHLKTKKIIDLISAQLCDLRKNQSLKLEIKSRTLLTIDTADSRVLLHENLYASKSLRKQITIMKFISQ